MSPWSKSLSPCGALSPVSQGTRRGDGANGARGSPPPKARGDLGRFDRRGKKNRTERTRPGAVLTEPIRRGKSAPGSIAALGRAGSASGRPQPLWGATAGTRPAHIKRAVRKRASGSFRLHRRGGTGASRSTASWRSIPAPLGPKHSARSIEASCAGGPLPRDPVGRQSKSRLRKQAHCVVKCGSKARR